MAKRNKGKSSENVLVSVKQRSKYLCLLICILIGAAFCKKNREIQIQRPTGHGYHAMAYDSGSDRVILYGGMKALSDEEYWQLSEVYSNETWAYDYNTNSWNRMKDGPPGRFGHCMVYDSESDVIILFSGTCLMQEMASVAETWAYDFDCDTWTEMKPEVSPPPRRYHGMAYDSESDRVILWGGWLGKEEDSSIWVYDHNTNTWTEWKTASGPGFRCSHALTYDDESNCVVLYGGGDKGSDETWLYDFNIDTWTNITVLQGEYMGQRKPGFVPEVFAPQVITPKRSAHSSVVISANGKEIYWTSFLEDTMRGVIMISKQEREEWTAPKPVLFSDSYDARNPFLALDGKALYFFGKKTEKRGDSNDFKIWIAFREKDTWTEPTAMGPAVNSGKWDAGPSVSRNGTIYFASYRESSKGMFDIYRVEHVQGRYLPAERMGEAINSDSWDLYPYVAPDESFLIFSSKREGSYGGQDLYISFRNADGAWSPARNMGPTINSRGDELFPFVTQDRRFMFFGKTDPDAETSFWVDVYWVDAGILEELKRQ